MSQRTTLAPMLAVKGAATAIDFCTKAFGATELYRLTGPDGSIVHADKKG